MTNNISESPGEKYHPTEDEVGASLMEYALLGTLIFAVALIAVRYFGTSVSGQFVTVSQQLS